MTNPLSYSIHERTFHFKFPAGTSRGVYHTRRCWMVTLSTPDGRSGTGECAPLPQLSADCTPHYAQLLEEQCSILARTGHLPTENLRTLPSMRFGLETALAHLQGHFQKNAWSRGQVGIPINGLVWMGTMKEMRERLEEKIEAGFDCIKLKIGVYPQEELQLIQSLRDSFPADRLQLRVDANGAFTPTQAPELLLRLHALHLHSIEQPIRAGQPEAMAWLCRTSPLPIALDEELIGLHHTAEKNALLTGIRPQFLVLKPSLHGGMLGTKEWVDMAAEHGIGSWITSALESNIGLHAIAHLATQIYGPHISMAQGLGTGLLYTDNIPMSLEIRGQYLWHT